jgi:hypothetical protein
MIWKGKLWVAIVFFILTGVALVGHSWNLFSKQAAGRTPANEALIITALVS